MESTAATFSKSSSQTLLITHSMVQSMIQSPFWTLVLKVILLAKTHHQRYQTSRATLSSTKRHMHRTPLAGCKSCLSKIQRQIASRTQCSANIPQQTITPSAVPPNYFNHTSPSKVSLESILQPSTTRNLCRKNWPCSLRS